MRPNIDKEKYNTERILFECKCGGHYLQLFVDKDDDEGVWFNFIDYPNSLWQAIKWWWKDNKFWFHDVELSISDCKAIRNTLDKHIKQYAQQSKNKKKTSK